MWSLESDTFPTLLPMTNRSKGPHVSDVIKHLGKFRGIPFRDESRGMSEMGNCIEWAFKQRYYRHEVDILGKDYFEPGELELDGIFGTLDMARGTSGNIRRVIEFKFRYDRAPNIPEDKSNDTSVEFDKRFWPPRIQLMSYCRMAECVEGELIVVFMQRHPGIVPYRRWRKTFNVGDLVNNWGMVLGTAKVLEKQS